MQGKALQIAELIRPSVEALDVELWGVELSGSGKDLKLVIYIEREDGVNVDHCADVSRRKRVACWMLKIPSRKPTNSKCLHRWDRPLYALKHYQSVVGSEVRIKLRFPLKAGAILKVLSWPSKMTKTW